MPVMGHHAEQLFGEALGGNAQFSHLAALSVFDEEECQNVRSAPVGVHT